MRRLLRIAVLVSACAILFQSGWVSYSQEKECPTQVVPKDMTVKENFMSAHGLTQENFSIWLKEHSVWRNEHAEELGQFTFIPQDFDAERK